MSKPSSNYIARKYLDKNDVDIVADAVQHHQNVLLLGPRGTGKSSLAAVAAEKLGRKYCYIPCHTGATSEALLGQWIPRKDGSGYQWMDGILTAAVRHGKVCLLDEVNSLKPEVAFAIHGLLDHRRELVLSEKPDDNGDPEVVVAHKDFGLVAAGNPFYEGVRVMNEAFRDRFAVQLNLGYIKELDVAVIDRHPITEELAHEQQIAVKQFVEKVRAACKNGAIHSDVSTRAFLDFVENVSVHTFQSARVMFLARFDDEAEQNAVRTCFNEVWTSEGKVQKSVADIASNTKPKPGRAGKFGAGAPSAGTGDLAKQSF